MRVKVEFEAEASLHNEQWLVTFRDAYGVCRQFKPPTNWVTPLECPEPTEHGYFKVTYPNGLKEIVYHTATHWHIFADGRPNTWQELGNIIAVEKIEL